jgi:putative oxidoreductase
MGFQTTEKRDDPMTIILKRFYLKLISIGNSWQNLLLLAIRLFWGWSFFHAGFGKLLNIGTVVSYFESLNIPLAAFSAYSAAIVECFGGALLFLGLASRLVAIPLMITMIVAFLTAYPDAVKMIFSDPQSLTTKDPFCFFFAALIIFVFGPGKVSLDHWLERKYTKLF